MAPTHPHAALPWFQQETNALAYVQKDRGPHPVRPVHVLKASKFYCWYTPSLEMLPPTAWSEPMMPKQRSKEVFHTLGETALMWMDELPKLCIYYPEVRNSSTKTVYISSDSKRP